MRCTTTGGGAVGQQGEGVMDHRPPVVALHAVAGCSLHP